MGQDQKPDQPMQMPMPPPLHFNVGQAGDKVLVQIITTHILEPDVARQLAGHLKDAADDASRSILVPKKPPLIAVH